MSQQISDNKIFNKFIFIKYHKINNNNFIYKINDYKISTFPSS